MKDHTKLEATATTISSQICLATHVAQDMCKCRKCYQKRYKKKYVLENKDKLREDARRRYQSNPQKYTQKLKEYRQKYPEKANAIANRYKEQARINARNYRIRHKDKIKKRILEWKRKNPAYRRREQAFIKIATPKWLSAAHLREIEAIYANRPVGYQVDHIVPVKGRNVCGLHVPWNLQYLTASENAKKGNRHE